MNEETVPEILRRAAKTYEERNKLYGDNYKKFGAFMVALFPEGPPPLATVEDWNRFGIFIQVVAKATRYAENFASSGHADSAHDISVYGAMLEELTEEDGPIPAREGEFRLAKHPEMLPDLALGEAANETLRSRVAEALHRLEHFLARLPASSCGPWDREAVLSALGGIERTLRGEA